MGTPSGPRDEDEAPHVETFNRAAARVPRKQPSSQPSPPGAIYTGYNRGFLPVAEWLAVRALVCFPLAGKGAAIGTTAYSGRRLKGEFVWPLWEFPAGPETVRSLVAYPGLQWLRAEARRALGISLVLRAKLTKKADGYSGMFAVTGPA